MSTYELPKIKRYVEAILNPIIVALRDRQDKRISELQNEIDELRDRINILENS
jgi:hypothetical protein